MVVEMTNFATAPVDEDNALESFCDARGLGMTETMLDLSHSIHSIHYADLHLLLAFIWVYARGELKGKPSISKIQLW